MREVEKEKILDAAFRVFVREKIEPTQFSMIAKEAGVGRATIFRHYPTKLDLVIAVNAAKWKEYFDAIDASRPLNSVDDIPAIDRFIFTLDMLMDLYAHHKDLLQFNDNFNHYVSHAGVDSAQLLDFRGSIRSADQRFYKMYEKAKEDHTLRTDLPFDVFMRTTVHVMMSSCTYYASGFIWGAGPETDYLPELEHIRSMLLDYATQGTNPERGSYETITKK